MKKLVLIALMIAMLLAVPALAEDAAAPAEEGTTVTAVQMDWNQDVINAFVAAGFDGNMATVTLKDGLAFQILIPDGFQQRDLTEEEAETGVVLALANEETGTNIRVMDSVKEEAGSLSEIARNLLTQDPNTAIQFAVINGTPALISGLQAEDSIIVSFDLGESRFVQIDFAPLSGNNVLAQFFLAAIQF